MTLAVSFNVFDGVELLKYTINQIRNQVDFIMINYQSKSWYGKPIKNEDLLQIIELKKSGAVDHLNCFQIPQIAYSPAEAKVLETCKRNVGKDYCYAKGFSHFLDVDVDEFYIEEEFERAKQFIIDRGIYYSAVKYKNYCHLPTIRSTAFSEGIIPLICKLDNKPLGGAAFLGKTDPTRAYNIDRLPDHIKHVFDPSVIYCHHMTNVRKDLGFKYQSTSLANFDRNRTNELISNVNYLSKDCLSLQTDISILNKEYEVVPNLFNIEGLSV